MTFFDHLEGRERLFGLIVIVEVPRQIRCEKQDNCKRSYDPDSPAVLKQTIGPGLFHDPAQLFAAQ